MQASPTTAPATDIKRGSSPSRLSEIDTAKGMGIGLVVFGHMVARDLKPQGNDWWIAPAVSGAKHAHRLSDEFSCDGPGGWHRFQVWDWNEWLLPIITHRCCLHAGLGQIESSGKRYMNTRRDDWN